MRNYFLTLIAISILICNNLEAKTFPMQSAPAYKQNKVNPNGKIVDKLTGKAISKAKIVVYDPTRPTENMHTEYSDSNGEFKFNHIPSIKYVYKIIISSKNYGSIVIDWHTSYKCDYTIHKLEPKGKGILVNCNHLGMWKYNREGDTYYYNNGVAENRDDYFFPKANDSNSEYVEKLKKEMNLRSDSLKTDAEAYQEFQKVWKFWKKHYKNGMRFREETKEANKFLFPKNPGSKGRWPSIGEYAEAYYKFGYLVNFNCSATSIQFANLLNLTTIPRDQIAIELCYSKEHKNIEHWSIIFKVYGTWFWYDPQCVWKDVARINYRMSFPYDRDIFHASPFKIIRFPGENKLKVPLCSYR